MSIDSGFVILASSVPGICWVMTILVKNVQHVIVMKWIWYQYVKQKHIGSSMEAIFLWIPEVCESNVSLN